MHDHTGSRTPQRAIQLAHSFRTTVLVETPEHLDPTNPGFCYKYKNMSVLARS